MNEPAPATLWPTYALRAWLAAIQAQTQRARTDLEALIQYHETEIERVRGRIQRANDVLASLQGSVELVDQSLSQVRDAPAKDDREGHAPVPAAEGESRPGEDGESPPEPGNNDTPAGLNDHRSTADAS